MTSVSTACGPPTSSGCAVIAAVSAAIPSGLARAKPANMRAISVSESAKVGTPQPSIAVSIGPRPPDRLGDERQDLLLERVLGQPVALASQPRARQRKRKPACLPEQLWRRREPCSAPHSRSSVEAPARSSSARTATSCSGAPRARRTRSRARPAAGRRRRAAAPAAASPRSGRRRRGPGRPRTRRPPPSRTTTACARWRDSTRLPTGHGYIERVHEEEDYSRVSRGGGGAADARRADRARSPVAKAGPAHVATLKTFDPPLSALEGRRFAGRGGAASTSSSPPTTASSSSTCT